MPADACGAPPTLAALTERPWAALEPALVASIAPAHDVALLDGAEGARGAGAAACSWGWSFVGRPGSVHDGRVGSNDLKHHCSETLQGNSTTRAMQPGCNVHAHCSMGGRRLRGAASRPTCRRLPASTRCARLAGSPTGRGRAAAQAAACCWRAACRRAARCAAGAWACSSCRPSAAARLSRCAARAARRSPP